MSYLICGGRKLEGAFTAHGAKNAALPALAAALLCKESVLENCPDLSDISAACAILRHLGSTVTRSGDTIHIVSTGETAGEIPAELMGAMRSSIVFLGALLARCGSAVLTAPGGCELGARPIDFHLDALRQMGAEIEEDGGLLRCFAAQGLHGAELSLPLPSVGATENILIAACTAKGRTLLHGAAAEPEIADLAAMLVSAGARICRHPNGTIEIEGVPTLGTARHSVMPDRIEAMTILAAVAVTGGRAEARGIRPWDMGSGLAFLERAGCDIIIGHDSLRLYAPERLRAFGSIITQPYPGFPTDLQAIYMAAAASAQGDTFITERIFSGRFRHIPELLKFGADISVNGNTAAIRGQRLHGAEVSCTDLRGGAALAVAALAADGESIIDSLRHIRRGYEDLEGTLASLGADIGVI